MARYLDAEKLKHILNNSKYYGKKQGNDFADMITECEAEDVAPVKHGYWKEQTHGYYECSVCLELTNNLDSEGFPIGASDRGELAHFCPNCGAKMDRKENE